MSVILSTMELITYISNTIVKGCGFEACCLMQDFQNLPLQDMTVVGEKGVNLSGGQKVRISLARAVYADNDLYLLDDPLSAVDSRVAQMLFNNVIKGLLRKKGVLLITHQLNYATQCDDIVVLNNEGKIALQGSLKEVDLNEINLDKYIQTESDQKRIQLIN
ncbi:hypothetical protein IMG5_062060 [Ichthyophthirius multifiliis]|uniref:ABC transporter domain-containing protein n=1 Tax=Ichthyophthirius multifiliis TaxID=5932 RepID=G0QNW9_ICHMU|nr:hypothetical protein IMG5_062060 [Ichthyophthirius multifiliis]EGR33084.1 hypothetical protein IMG5_062060 [Ichthyophthirius multifiliis]|eukprot:XP_004037070.1 hypothetical protein IMG5_062060 [Ichthyophthirius multifiliis]